MSSLPRAMPSANAVLSHALAGLLNSLPNFQAVFAPHANSYRRYGAGLLVPLHLAWGYEHRSVALRVIDPHGPAARIEHRVAGADANPYLVVAAVLAGLLKGLAEQSDPGPPIQISHELARLPRINRLWATAIKAFAESSSPVKPLEHHSTRSLSPDGEKNTSALSST